MPKLTLASVPPTAIDTHDEFFDTFGHMETEIVARNVVLISKWHGGWFGFSWEDYQNFCKHRVFYGEKYELERLVEKSALLFKNGQYIPTDAFVEALKEYVKS